MTKIPQELIEEIRAHSSITEVIGNYIPLVKKGRAFTAVCPFHDDHDPSLSISDQKQIFKCFVCGVGGNVFSFVTRYKKCSFEEAVAEVAKISNIPFNYNVTRKQEPKQHFNQRYFDLMNLASEYTNYLLRTEKAQKALTYLNNRGLDLETIDYFNIGYNPSDNDLRNYLLKKEYKDEELIEVNLARITDFGIKDVFYNRITFPIHDIYGNTIAFSARAIEKNDAKYINTSETKIYIKGDVLYNFHRAKDDIKQSSRVFILEGVMDVIAMYRAGFKNCVSSLGTSFTKKQLEILKKVTNILIFNFDGDKAGKAATIKAGKMALENGFEVFVVKNNTLKDPDEIINEAGKNALRSIVDNQYSFIEFAMEYYDNGLESYIDKKEYNQNIGELIDLINNPEDKINFSLILKEKTNIVRKEKNIKNSLEIGYNKKNYSETDVIGALKAEYTILSQIMYSPKALEDYKSKLGYLNDKNHNKIVNEIIEQYRKYGNFSYSRFCDEVQNQELIDIVLNIGNQSTLKQEYQSKILDDCIAVVKKETARVHKEEILKQLEINKHLDNDKIKKLLNELSKINRKLGGKNG